MNDFRPIETRYKGYRFRSRLEARWAVFLDALAAEWKYEDEGYHLPNGELYLPDFWLPQLSLFAEVKGKDFTQAERDRCRWLAEHSGHTVMLLEGVPDLRLYEVYIGGNAKLELQAFDSEAYRVDMAVEAARSARFEHGEAGISVAPVPKEPARRRSVRHGAEAAERILIRAILRDRSRLEMVAERVSPRDLAMPSYRAIYEALLESDPDVPLSSLAVDVEALATAELLLADDAESETDLRRTLDDAIARINVRTLEQRILEIDTRLSHLPVTERALLEEERTELVLEMRAEGAMRWKATRRGRT